MELLVLSAVVLLGQPPAPPPDDFTASEVVVVDTSLVVCDNTRCTVRVSHRNLNRIAKGSTWREVRVCGPNGCEKIRVMSPEQPTMFKGKRYRYRGIVAGSCNISIKYCGRRAHGFWRVRYSRHKGG